MKKVALSSLVLLVFLVILTGICSSTSNSHGAFMEAVNNSTAQMWYEKGNELADRGNYIFAIKSYEEVIAMFPCASGAWNNKALALSALGRHNEALAAINKAIECKPQEAALHFNKGNILTDIADAEAY